MRSRRRSRYRKHTAATSQQLLLALIDLYQMLRTPRPLDSLLQAILDTAIAYVPGAQRGSLMVLEGDVMCYRVAFGYDLDQLRAVSFPADNVCDALFHGDRVIQICNLTELDQAFLGAEAYQIMLEHGHVAAIRRSMVTAIMLGGAFYGTLTLDNLHDPAPFPPEAEALALLLAEHAGALLEQALLIERLHQANTRLVESEKLAGLGRFIANIAHEINNPLTAVIGYSDFLAEAEMSLDSQEMLGQVRAGAERVRAIVRNLQIFARQQKSGEMPVSLSQIAEQALTLKRGDYTLDMIEVQTDLHPDLPLLWGDGGQLSQVLLNLLVNAQHALRQRQPPRQLTLRTWREGGEGAPARLLLSVRDNGPGIAPAVIGRIFEPFFTTRPPGQGTGLGLSICAEIIQHHGGAIRVASEPGAGAEFTIDLPLRAMPHAPAPAPATPAPPAARHIGLRILSVDDDPVVRAVIRRTLGDQNDLVLASGGAEALRLIVSETFDLVLCDLRMPELSGEQLYRLVAAIRPEAAAHFLFISGDTSSAMTRAFLAEAGRPLLAKPFTAAELLAAIAGVVGAP
ncbi:response regulator [Oscillochloris sp. ZM17-4]|uniref:hybrid sensor histidine kinase/response regulator n=1 Tax=Oscillochloris sp. ZM17-4 TaxID=2866714 RepID=UPI001C72E51F|nr:ATP-binding protein [Oscillochloris sp. ZM17-4]MBX0326328.1 response regulator [Oscillochloris sp. ZM17-4]